MAKLRLKDIFIAATSWAILLLCGCGQLNQTPPIIKQGEFPFRFIYELDGKRYDIEDTIICEYKGMDAFLHVRTWNAYLKSGADRISMIYDRNVNSVLKKTRINNSIEVYLDYGAGAYYMGDTQQATGLIHGKPHICYIEDYETSSRESHNTATPLTEEQAENLFGIKIIEFTFSTPIENTFEK